MSTTVRPPFTRRLRHGDIVRFDRPRQLCVRAVHGSLWITIDGRRDDIQLDAGDSRVFDGRDRVLVSALAGDAVIAVTSRAPLPLWRRLVAALQGRLAATTAGPAEQRA